MSAPVAPREGVAYRWEERLGGRRRLGKGVQPADTWWRVEAFRAYAEHTRSAAFRQALARRHPQPAPDRRRGTGAPRRPGRLGGTDEAA